MRELTTAESAKQEMLGLNPCTWRAGGLYFPSLEVLAMKLVTAALVCVLAFSVFVVAQTTPDVEKALLAAPAQMRDAATVIKWKSDFTYDTIKKGTNRLVCYDRPVGPGQQPFSVECTSIANLDRVAVSLKLEQIADPMQRRAAFEEAEKAGKWPKPEFGSIFYNFSGANQAQARSHATICVPGATTQTLSLPENGNQGGAWIMNAGTSAAHIMMPGH
jgi:hypothetical protein